MAASLVITEGMSIISIPWAVAIEGILIISVLILVVVTV